MVVVTTVTVTLPIVITIVITILVVITVIIVIIPAMLVMRGIETAIRVIETRIRFKVTNSLHNSHLEILSGIKNLLLGPRNLPREANRIHHQERRLQLEVPTQT